MKNAIKKAISVLLVAVMVFGAAPLAGFVGLELPELNLFSTKAEAATSGTCGENLTWTFDEATGELVISGTGAMTDWSYSSKAPWYSYCWYIKSVEINDGVTSIGIFAFNNCISLESITIPDSVTSIGVDAFYWCSALTSITIPDSVTSIGDSAFYWCGALTSITIPDSVTSIGNSAFYGCTSLESITIPDSVTSIGDYAFGNCSSLASITIPDSVTSIGDSAFYRCGALTSITIPDSVTSIGDSVFDWCEKLAGINVDSANTVYSSDEYGVMFNKNKTELLRYPMGNTRTSYTIPDSITSIGYSAFEDSSSLTSITIPDSVTTIDNWAFYGCSRLTSITIPDSVTSISTSAFFNCTKLAGINVDSANTVYSSDEYGVMFNKDKTELLLYPMGNTRTSYTIPDSVTSIGYPAFGDCSNLTSITIPESVTKISSYAFKKCTSLASITIPDGVTSIGSSTFENCTRLASITIPDSVTSIGDNAFYLCNKLADVCYSGTKEQSNNIIVGEDNECLLNAVWRYVITGECGDNLVWSLDYESGELTVSGTGEMIDLTDPSSAPWYGKCSLIKSVTIADGVTSIGDYAFNGYDALESVTIGNGVTRIGNYAFYDCYNLTTTYYAGTPEQWKNITIGTDNDNLTKNIIYECNSERPYYKGGTCGENLGWKLCADGELVISGTGAMTDWSYYSSVPWYSKGSLIKSVTISDGVTSIGSYAFYYCNNLASVKIGNGVTQIGESAFDNTALYNDSSNWEDDVLYIGNCLIKAKRTVSGEYQIKDGTKVIADEAFYNCSELTAVTIPDSVTSIGDYAFYSCSNLESITIPDNIKRIGDYAFAYCSKISTVNYSVTVEQWNDVSIGSSNERLVQKIVFKDNPDLTCLNWGTCGSDLRWKLYSNGELIISGTGAMTNWTSSSSAPWYSKSSLIKSVTISDGVTSIGSYAFYYCYYLESVTIPESVTSIGSYAFYYCHNLESVTIPESVTSIGNYAFYSCDNLKTACYAGNSEQWKEISIGNSNGYLTKNVIYECNSERPYYDGGACGENLSWKLYADGELVISGTGAMTNWTYYSSVPWDSKSSLIKSVTLSDGVTSIGSYAFYYCNNLASIKIGNGVTQIGESAFVGTALYSDSSNWEDDVLYIGNCLIKAGSAVSGEYQIKDGTKVIADKAFYNCSELTAVTIPDSVTGIGDYAFYGCSKLSNAYYTGSPEQWGAVAVGLYNNSSIYNIIFDADSDRPYHAGTCGENLIWKIYVDSTELEICGTGAMTDWSSSSKAPWYKYSSQIESVKIQDGVTTIGKYAFYDCDLESVTIPDSVTVMGNDAFYYASLTNVYYTGSLAEWCAIEFENISANPMYYADNIYIDGDLINGNFVIPKEITSIGAYAFVGYSDLVTVTLHSGITSIGKSAFDGCGDLYKVNYPGTLEQWQNIPGSSDNKDLEGILVFECNSLNPYYGGTCGEDLRWKMHVKGTELFISGTGPMEDYGYYAVSAVTTAPWRKQSSRIKTVTISDGVTSVGDCAFLNCKSLKNANLPDSIETIEAYAFAGCNILSKIKLPDSLTYIGNYAFWYCYPLSKVEIPDGVTQIGKGAFDGCSLIVSVTIPKSVTSICEDAFAGCSNIIAVYYAGSKADWEEIIIYSGNETLTSAAILYNQNGGSGGGSTSDSDNTPDYDSSVTDKLLVSTPSQTTVSYGDSIVLHMDSSKIPEGGKVEWYPSNKNFSHSVSADGTTCTITPSKSGDTTFTAVVYDAEGNIVSADEQKMTSKAGFFDKLIAFFKKLFGATKVIPQAFRNIY